MTPNPSGINTPAPAVRAADMVQRYRSGQTLHEIGAHYGITRERVRQILAKRGITRDQGGAHVQSLRKSAARIAKRDERYMRRHGCTYEQYRAICPQDWSRQRKGRERTPMGAFLRQRSTAKARGIAWEFTFWSWWQLWQKSGKWSERGRGGFCMARPGDSGPYAPHNVEIITHSQNSKDSRANHPLSYSRTALATLGTGRGWIKTGLKSKPFGVNVRGKYYGCYATEAEAVAVYRRVCAQFKRELRQALKRAA